MFTPPLQRACCVRSHAREAAESLSALRRSGIAGGVAKNSRPIIASARTNKPVYPSTRDDLTAIPFLSVEFAFERKLGIPVATRNRFPGCGTRTNPLRGTEEQEEEQWAIVVSRSLSFFLRRTNQIGFSREKPMSPRCASVRDCTPRTSDKSPRLAILALRDLVMLLGRHFNRDK